MPSSLAEILIDPVDHRYPVDGTGYTPRAGTWSPPAVVTPEIQAAAREHLAIRDQQLSAMATPAIAATWVTSLGVLVAGRAMSAEDARTKALAYATMIAGHYPAAVLTDDTLRRAAEAFRFFPSFAEIAERLDLETSRLRRERDKLAKLAADPKAPPTPQSKITGVLAQATAAVTSKAPAVEKREPILSHPPTDEQLAEWKRDLGITP